jgi:hypothetical protein
MARPSDNSALPGELVSVRVTTAAKGLAVWSENNTLTQMVKGWVPADDVGIIIVPCQRGFTFVMWSRAQLVGWVSDGNLRRVNLGTQRTPR